MLAHANHAMPSAPAPRCHLTSNVGDGIKCSTRAHQAPHDLRNAQQRSVLVAVPHAANVCIICPAACAGDGSCKHIPQLAQVQPEKEAQVCALPRSAVPAFPMGRCNGLLWVWLAPGAEAFMKAAQCASSPMFLLLCLVGALLGAWPAHVLQSAAIRQMSVDEVQAERCCRMRAT